MPKVKVIKAGHVAGIERKVGEVLDLSQRQTDTGLRRGRIEIIKEGAASAKKPDEAGSGGPAAPETPVVLTVAQLKAKLDELKVEYPANAAKSVYETLLANATPDPLA